MEQVNEITLNAAGEKIACIIYIESTANLIVSNEDSNIVHVFCMKALELQSKIKLLGTSKISKINKF